MFEIERELLKTASTSAERRGLIIRIQTRKTSYRGLLVIDAVIVIEGITFEGVSKFVAEHATDCSPR